MNSWCISLLVKSVLVYLLIRQSAAASAWHMSKLDPGSPGKKPKSKENISLSVFVEKSMTGKDRTNFLMTALKTLVFVKFFHTPSFHFWNIQSIAPERFNPRAFHPVP